MARLYRRGKVYWARTQRQNRELRRSLKTADRAIAEKRLRTWLDALDAQAWGDRPRYSYVQAEEKFIREHLTSIKPRAAERYAVSLKHLSEHFGDKLLDRITSGELSSFETKRRGQGVAPGTIRRDLACLSSLLTSCEDWEWIDGGGNLVPAYLRRRAKRGLKESPPRTRYLTEDEEVALLRAATLEVRQAITLAIDTGLRREELFSLTWGQIDQTRGLVSTTTMTKSGRLRKVPLPERSRTVIGTLPRYLDSPYLLVNPETRSRYVQMNKGLAGAARRSLINDLCWHDLRRTAGCRWLQRDGKSMEEVSVMLGHSSVLVTEKCYAFLDAEQVAQSLASAQLSAQGQRTQDEIPVMDKELHRPTRGL
jgi:integrase